MKLFITLIIIVSVVSFVDGFLSEAYKDLKNKLKKYLHSKKP